MEKEFVDYREALDLKELGFDVPCFGFHSKIHGLMMVKTSSSSSLYKDAGECLAPTYSQVFRFFREKYNLDSFVKCLYKSTIKVGYYFCIDEYKGIDFQMDLDDYYKTYEEAELSCLKKLIEICRELK